MHPDLWPRDILQARHVQELLRKKVWIRPCVREPEFVAAVDASFTTERILAVASLYRYPELFHQEDSIAQEQITFPYVSGYLSFREGHAMIQALQRLKRRPDVVLVDGQGIAHPRGFGIASHIGVIMNISTIGCAKSRLVGEYRQPGRNRGHMTYLKYKGIKVGAVLRTRDSVRPVFVSPGHKIDIPGAVEIIMKCVTRFRIPEPLRRADMLSKKMKRDIAG